MHRPRSRTLLARYLATVALVAGAIVALGSQPAEAAPTATVMATTTQRMSGPSLNTAQHGTYTRGSRLTLTCYSRGQSVRGYYSSSFPNGYDNLWYKVSDGYWAADVDLNTGSNTPVTPACTTAVSIDTNRWYTITDRHSGKRIDVRGGVANNGTPLQQYNANTTNSQIFRFVATGGGFYEVISKLSPSNSARVWDVSRGGTANGTKVQTYTWNRTTSQQWMPVSAGSGYVYFKPRNATGRCLDVPGGSTSSGVQLQIYTCNSTTGQQWKLTAGSQIVTYKTAGACNAPWPSSVTSRPFTYTTATIGTWKVPVCGPAAPPSDDGKHNTEAWPGFAQHYGDYLLGYQCTELTLRWLHYKLGGYPAWTAGKDFAARNAPTYGALVTNGSSGKKPSPGDLISFAATASNPSGHVALVYAVNVNSSGNGTVGIVEQNSPGKHNLTMTGWKIQHDDTSGKAISWLHVK